jgi:hypothetical protein
MEAGANFNAEGSDLVGNGARAAHPARRTVEGSKNAIAGRFDLVAAKAREIAPDCGVVIVQEIAPAAIAERRGLLG